jgi:hypothetical protein
MKKENRSSASELELTQTQPRLIFRILTLVMLPVLLMFLFHLARFALGDTQFPATSLLDYGVKLFVALVISPTTVIVGLWCLRRSPGNVIGAILVLWGVGVIDLIRSDTSSLGTAFSSIFAGVRWAALFSLLVYFPDGNVIPRRYQKIVDLLILIAMVTGVLSGMGRELAPNRGLPNPLYITSLAPLSRFFEVVNGFLSLTVGWIFGIVSLFLRYRRANFAQRNQIKWLPLVFAPVAFFLPVQLIVENLAPQFSVSVSAISGSIILAWFMSFPLIAVGNAILRHKLYDIDIIIRRTLIYTVLTGILAALYFGAIILTQQVFRAATGQTSDLAIVVSTLLIAALFSPVRRRVQDVIDRRLYRRKYDVEQTLADFQKNLREDVDMETLQANLIGVVSETMQPNKIALWVPTLNESRMTKIMSPKNS